MKSERRGIFPPLDFNSWFCFHLIYYYVVLDGTYGIERNEDKIARFPVPGSVKIDVGGDHQVNDVSPFNLGYNVAQRSYLCSVGSHYLLVKEKVLCKYFWHFIVSPFTVCYMVWVKLASHFEYFIPFKTRFFKTFSF